jgi:hypothetical protein
MQHATNWPPSFLDSLRVVVVVVVDVVAPFAARLNEPRSHSCI